MRAMEPARVVLSIAALCALALAHAAAASSGSAGAALDRPPETAGGPTDGQRLDVASGDRLVLVGNTLAERQQHFNHFETLLMTRFPDLQLVVRNLGWSGDTLTLQPRPLNFGDATYHLTAQRADVVLAFFGLNESFDGETGLRQFESDLDAYLRMHLAAAYNGRTAPRLALVSPVAHEPLERLPHVDTAARNRELARYTAAMRRAAASHGIAFVDLFTPTAQVMTGAPEHTINGIHLNDRGDRLVAELLIEGLGFGLHDMREASGRQTRDLERLREQIRVKNEEFFRRWRPLNAEYVVGRRVEPFGSASFPTEMRELDRRVADMDRQIWRRARSLAGVRFPLAHRGDPEPARPTGTSERQEQR